jgi:hypothetical protein
MTPRFNQIRYSLRGLIDQIAGYCDVLTQQLEASEAGPLRAGLADIRGIAATIGPALDAS